MNKPGFKAAVVPIVYYKDIHHLKKLLNRYVVEADKAHKDGANILILSDRGVDEYHVADSITSCSCFSCSAASCNNKEENNVWQ